MRSPVTLLTSVLVLFSVTDCMAFAQECEEDHECSDGRFCYQNTRVCAPCIVCAAYNRNKPSKHCAKAWQDCGACLNGFTSEAIPGAVQRGNCVAAALPLMDSPPPTIAGGMNMTGSMSETGQIILIVGIGLALTSGGVYLAIKGRQRVRRQQPDVECGPNGASDGDIPLIPRSAGLAVDQSSQDRPPPSPDRDRDQAGPLPPAYDQLKHTASFGQACPSAPPAYSEQTEPQSVLSIDVHVSQVAEDKLQQARPFHVPPNARYHLNEGGGQVEVVETETEEEEEDDGAESQDRATPVNPNEDDSTMPSPWVPAADDLNDSGSLGDSGVCNFSESPSSSLASLQESTVPTDFRGMFANGGLVAQAVRRDSSGGASAGERPAKRFRTDSGSHSAESSSSEDESPPGAQAVQCIARRGVDSSQ